MDKLEKKEGLEQTETTVNNFSEGTGIEEQVEEASEENNGGAESTSTDIIKKHFPGIEVSDANREVLQSAAEKLERLDKLNAINEELSVLFSSFPEVAQAINDWRQGAPFLVALAKYVDIDSVKPVEGDEYYKDWESNRATWKENYNKQQQGLADAEAARDKAVEILLEWKKKHGKADEEAGDFFKWAITFIDAWVSGTLTVEQVERMFNAMNYESDIETTRKDALEEGNIAGRNAKISSMKKKEEDKKGTGLAELDGGGGEIPDKKKETPDPFLDDLEKIGNKKSIYN